MCKIEDSSLYNIMSYLCSVMSLAQVQKSSLLKFEFL